METLTRDQHTMTTSRTTAFHELHRSGCFVIPNPFDVGSAKLLAQLGFRALASTSSGFAWSLGKQDNHVTLSEALEHFRALAASVPVPVSADFEGAFAVEPDDVAANVASACRTGLAGLSVEDSTHDPAHPLFDFEHALDRVRAAREAINASGTGVLLTARSEGFVSGRPDLDETIRRLRAYADAGADCLFAPGLKSLDQVRAIVQGVAPKPVNVLVSSDWTTVEEIAAAGVRRISVGGGLARAAWSGFLAAAREIATEGTFKTLGAAVAGVEINRAFAEQ